LGPVIRLDAHSVKRPNRSPAPSDLSEAEESPLPEIFASHGGKTRWQFRDFCHTLPQWQERQLQKSRQPLPLTRGRKHAGTNAGTAG